MDNALIERPWCSLKHEEIYLRGYADGFEERREIPRVAASSSGGCGPRARPNAPSITLLLKGFAPAWRESRHQLAHANRPIGAIQWRSQPFKSRRIGTRDESVHSAIVTCMSQW
jgi:hypothetical protein